MIVLYAKIKALPGMRDAMIEPVKKCAEATQSDPGCIFYDFTLSVSDPDLLISVEVWQSMDLVQSHLETPQIKELDKALADLAAAPPELKVFEGTPIDIQ